MFVTVLIAGFSVVDLNKSPAIITGGATIQVQSTGNQNLAWNLPESQNEFNIQAKDHRPRGVGGR